MTLTMLFVLSAFNNVFGAALGTIETHDTFKVDAFESADATTVSTITGDLESVAGGVLGAVRIIFSSIALLIMMFIGVKYIIASPGERADLKKSSVQFVVGAVILFGAAGIFGIIEAAVNTALK